MLDTISCELDLYLVGILETIELPREIINMSKEEGVTGWHSFNTQQMEPSVVKNNEAAD